jgi:hypothetical protein
MDGKNMMEMEHICEKYAAGLEEKIRLLDCFRQATSKMKEALESNDIGQIDLHLKERQGIIQRIEKIDREIDGFVQVEGFRADKVSGKAKERLRGYIERMRSTLESLSGVDKDYLHLARAEHDRMKSEILGIHCGRRAAKGYRVTGHQNPRFLDMRR